MIRLLPFEYGVRNLGRSSTRLALSVGGSALMVLLVLAAGAFVRGMSRTLRATGSPQNVILLGAGSEESIERSEIPAGSASLIAASIPGIRARLGVPYASPQVHLALPVKRASSDRESELVVVRGVTPAALLVHPQVQILNGRMPTAGRDEVMVGQFAALKLGMAAGELATGATIWLSEKPWTIVGQFAAPGTVMDAEIWAPLTDLKTATKRETDSCIILTLDTAEFADVDAFCKQRPDLELSAQRESDYYAKLTTFFQPVRTVVWVTALLIGMGGLLGGMNTMYAAFASRVRELGMLQCLGYRRVAIIVSLVQESLLTTTAGALVACVVAILLLDGVAVRFTLGAFGLTVDAAVLVIGMIAGALLGFVGALPPAWRSMRMPIPESLKAI